MLVVAQAYLHAKQFGEVPYPSAAMSKYADPLARFQRGQPIEPAAGNALTGIMAFIKDIAAYKNDAAAISAAWTGAFGLPSPFKAGQMIGNITEATFCYFGVMAKSDCGKWPNSYEAELARRHEHADRMGMMMDTRRGDIMAGMPSNKYAAAQNMLGQIAQRAGAQEALHQQRMQQRGAAGGQRYPGQQRYLAGQG